MNNSLYCLKLWQNSFTWIYFSAGNLLQFPPLGWWAWSFPLIFLKYRSSSFQKYSKIWPFPKSEQQLLNTTLPSTEELQLYFSYSNKTTLNNPVARIKPKWEWQSSRLRGKFVGVGELYQKLCLTGIKSSSSVSPWLNFACSTLCNLMCCQTASRVVSCFQSDSWCPKIDVYFFFLQSRCLCLDGGKI